MGDLLWEAAKFGDLSKVTQYSAVAWQECIQKPVGCLTEACEHGHLAVAQWMHITFELCDQDGRFNFNSPLRWACKCGRLQVARWLHTTYHLTSDDARALNSEPLLSACEFEHLHVAQWLHITFGLTAEDAMKYDNRALKMAFHNQHLHVVQWLCITFGFALPWRTIYMKWTRQSQKVWYWQPHVVALASHLPAALLVDALRRIIPQQPRAKYFQ